MHDKEIPGFRLVANNAKQGPQGLRVRRGSPQYEAEAFLSDGPDPQHEPIDWSPITGAVGKITGMIDTLADAGKRIAMAPVNVVSDVLGTAFAAATGIPPAEPGPIFEAVTEAAQAAVSHAPLKYQNYAGFTTPTEIAGYITTADGRRIPVQKSTDPYTAGERARGELQGTASKAPNYDAAYNRRRSALEERRQLASENQWDRAFAVKSRQAAQQERLGQLQERALELAIERETSSPAQRALWGRPSYITPEPPRHRTVKMIGPGVPGGIQERLF